MRIDGIVSCVGGKYASILQKALPIWLDTLDSVTVVTDGTTAFRPPSGVRFFWTELFTAYGAFFNKGAALSSAYASVNPTDWILHFDADIIPPSNWRKMTEPYLKIGNLYGADRCYEDGRDVIDPPPFPYGFFHLWNVRDPRTWIRPLWELFWPSAGHYEIGFIERWPSELRVRLPFKVIHPLEPRLGWFGDSPEGIARMNRDIQVGHHLARLRKEFILKVPDFRNFLNFYTQSSDDALKLLQAHSSIDPFETYIRLVTKEMILL